MDRSRGHAREAEPGECMGPSRLSQSGARPDPGPTPARPRRGPADPRRVASRGRPTVLLRNDRGPAADPGLAGSRDHLWGKLLSPLSGKERGCYVASLARPGPEFSTTVDAPVDSRRSGAE